MGRKKEFNEEKALSEAIGVFWEKGYENTSLSDLLEKMDILNGSFYHTYQNKKNLFIAALNFYEKDFETKRTDLFKMDFSFGKKLWILFSHIFNRQQEGICPRGCFLFNSVSRDTVKDADLHKLIRNGVTKFEKFLESEITKAIEKNEISPHLDAKSTAAILVAYIQGLMSLSVLDYQDEKFRQQTKEFLKSLGF